MITLSGRKTESVNVTVSEYDYYDTLRNNKDLDDYILMTEIALNKWIKSLGFPEYSRIKADAEGDPRWFYEEEHHTSHSWYSDKWDRIATVEEAIIYEGYNSLIRNLKPVKVKEVMHISV